MKSEQCMIERKQLHQIYTKMLVKINKVKKNDIQPQVVLLSSELEAEQLELLCKRFGEISNEMTAEYKVLFKPCADITHPDSVSILYQENFFAIIEIRDHSKHKNIKNTLSFIEKGNNSFLGFILLENSAANRLKI